MNVIPGLSGYPQNGGVSIRWAQCVLLGSDPRPAIIQHSMIERTRPNGSVERGYRRLEPIGSAGPAGTASSPMELAAFGGNTDGMNRPDRLRVDDRKGDLVRLVGHEASPDSVALRPEVLTLVVETLGRAC